MGYRRFTSLFVCLCAWTLSLPAMPSAASVTLRTHSLPVTKHALLIGISTYDSHRGNDKDGYPIDWWNLHTENDIALLSETLRSKKFGFSDVKVLSKTEETTREQILKNIRELIARTNEGDVVYIHYSGHGQPAPDSSRPDGMVKTIVPSDYVSRRDTSRNIRGPEIGDLIDQLKAKKPSNITISFDSCFSFGGTRGDLGSMVQRGGDPLNLSGARSDSSHTDNFLNKVRLPEGYVFLSAASQIETAGETYIKDDGNKPIGLFTYALVRALNDADPVRTTYRDLMERISDMVKSERRTQTPNAEGRIGEQLFSGNFLPSERYVAAKLDDSKTRVTLQAGLLQGMTQGSKFEIYPSGTKRRFDKTQRVGPDNVPPIGEGLIQSVLPTSSVISLSAPAKDSPGGTLRAIEVAHNYSSVLKVAVDPRLLIKTRGAANALDVEELGLGEVADRADPSGHSWDIKIRPPNTACDPAANTSCKAEKTFSGVVIERSDGSVLSLVPDGSSMTAKVREVLERVSTYNVVRGLSESSMGANAADDGLRVKLRVVPMDVEESSDTHTVTVKGERTDGAAIMGSSKPTLRKGDYVMLELQNLGTRDAWVTVLDLQPDGKIGPLFPDPRLRSENLIKAGATYRIPYPYVFRLTEPLGVESFRLIATPQAADFSPLFDPSLSGRGDGDLRGGEATPLGNFLMRAQRGKRAEIAAPPAQWSTDSVSFLVTAP